MLSLKIKKGVKLQALLIIISLTIPRTLLLAQSDSLKMKKEITAILKKYGYKDASFSLKVESKNQKGGQTAFEINNYKGRELHIVNGPNYGINGNVYAGIEQRKFSTTMFNDMLKKIPSLNTPIKFFISGGKEGSNLAQTIATAFYDKGYRNFSWTNWMDPNDFDKIDYKLNNGVFEILIYPASNVRQ